MSFSAEQQARVQRYLDRIPGYRGYRSIDDRRQSDRQLREQIAAQLEQLAGRVETIGRQLSDERRLNEIAPIEQLSQRIRFLVNRIRSQPEGYGALFSGQQVDEAAIDQLMRFDSGIMKQVDTLGPLIQQLEASDGGQDLAEKAKNATVRVDRILLLLDGRKEVLSTAKEVKDPSVLELLEPPAESPLSELFDTLVLGATLSILGDNYLIDAVIQGNVGDGTLRLVRLEQSTGKWLLIASGDSDQTLLLETKEPAQRDHGSVEIGGEQFALQRTSTGQAELTGPSGTSPKRSIALSIYTSSLDPNRQAVIIDWGTESIVGAGTPVHPDDIEVFGKATG